jgi:5-methylcytosine-specific restriction protein A
MAVEGGSRCEAHGGLSSNWSKYKRDHPDRSSQYQSDAWRSLRDRVLQEEPTCRRCKRVPSTDVDHIVALADDGSFWDRENLQALCKPCHSAKTGEDNRARRKGRPR